MKNALSLPKQLQRKNRKEKEKRKGQDLIKSQVFYNAMCWRQGKQT